MTNTSTLDPLEMLLDAARFIEIRKPEWAAAARASVAEARSRPSQDKLAGEIDDGSYTDDPRLGRPINSTEREMIQAALRSRPQAEPVFQADTSASERVCDHPSGETIRRKAQGHADFWYQQAEKNEHRRTHYEVIAGQFQHLADDAGSLIANQKNLLRSQPEPIAAPPSAPDGEVVEALKEARHCIHDIGSGEGGWAWEEVCDRLTALIERLAAGRSPASAREQIVEECANVAEHNNWSLMFTTQKHREVARTVAQHIARGIRALTGETGK